MKITFVFIITVFVSSSAYSQDISYQELLSRRIADKMKDSLVLSNSQRDSIYTINYLLHERKSQIRRMGAVSDSSLTILIQQIENSRDSLYSPILGPEKFEKYKKVKSILVSAQ